MISVYYIKPMETLVLRQNENVSLTISFRAPRHFFQYNVKSMLNIVIQNKCMHP